jgi:hypothetical protein
MLRRVLGANREVGGDCTVRSFITVHFTKYY